MVDKYLWGVFKTTGSVDAYLEYKNALYNNLGRYNDEYGAITSEWNRYRQDNDTAIGADFY